MWAQTNRNSYLKPFSINYVIRCIKLVPRLHSITQQSVPNNKSMFESRLLSHSSLTVHSLTVCSHSVLIRIANNLHFNTSNKRMKFPSNEISIHLSKKFRSLYKSITNADIYLYLWICIQLSLSLTLSFSL